MAAKKQTPPPSKLLIEGQHANPTSSTPPSKKPKATLESISEQIQNIKDGCEPGEHEYEQGAGQFESVLFCKGCGDQIALKADKIEFGFSGL